MSENHQDCTHFEAWLVDDKSDIETQAWIPHLDECATCRGQWVTHQMLAASLADEIVPELSPTFDHGLQRKIDSVMEIKPLRGWRLAVMFAYTFAAAALLRWVFARFPLPAITIDPSSPWTMAIAIAAVPLTLWAAIGATRWLPTAGKRGFSQLSLL